MLPDAECPSTVPVKGDGLGGSGCGPLPELTGGKDGATPRPGLTGGKYGATPLPGLTGKDGAGLGGRRGGPEVLFDVGGGKLGTGGGAFLGGELGTSKEPKHNNYYNN